MPIRNRQGSRTSIFELGPKERFHMIKEVNDHRRTLSRNRKRGRAAVIAPGTGSNHDKQVSRTGTNRAY